MATRTLWRAGSNAWLFLPSLLTGAQLASSKTEANRLLKHGAVQIAGSKIEPGVLEIEVTSGQQLIIRVAKRRFARVTAR